MPDEPSKLAFDDGWQYAPAPESTDHIAINDNYGLFIGGDFVEPADGLYFDTINPATEERLASVALAGRADVDRAVKSARRALRGEGNVASTATCASGRRACSRLRRVS